MPFNLLGVQPLIRDGLRGEGLVTKSAAGPDVAGGSGENQGWTGTWRLFTATTPMIVTVPDHPRFAISPQRLASRRRYAVIGMRLPLTVSRNLRSVRIEWDEVPTIDELIAGGAPTFTDPDSVAAELRQQWADVASPIGGVPPQRRSRTPIDGPSARVMAVGHGANDHRTPIGKWELLLSVSVPGRPRFGYRYTKKLPRRLILLPGTDVPVKTAGSGLEIQWDRVESAWDEKAVHNAAMAAMAAKQNPAGAPTWAEVPAPTITPAPVAEDPLDQLKRLGELRDAGVLTDAEFAAEKARVLEQI
jgi:hypothetical protein